MTCETISSEILQRAEKNQKHTYLYTKKIRSGGNISSLHLEFLWQPGKNQKKKVVFPERREGGTVVLPERSEGKTVPPSVVRVKHSSEGYFSGSS